MERVEGRPDLSSADSPEEARAVLDEFVDLLARMHQIDVRQLGDLELKIPENAEEVALGDLGHWIRSYRERKVRPDPLVEFLIRWVHANVPQGRRKVALLQGDPGQFLFDKGRVTARISTMLQSSWGADRRSGRNATLPSKSSFSTTSPSRGSTPHCFSFSTGVVCATNGS